MSRDMSNFNLFVLLTKFEKEIRTICLCSSLSGVDFHNLKPGV